MNQRKLAREKLLFRYTNALERGDFATVEAILQEAQHDAELERMIAEINAALSQEMPKLSARPALNNHRYNHKDSTMYQNPTFPRTADLSREKRFPYALAAAILAVVLVGGLLITAKFGFDNQGENTGGASLQRESATPIASMTPSPLNPIAVSVTPTALPTNVNPADFTATPLPFDPSMITPVRFPHYDAMDVLCTAVISIKPSVNQPNPSAGLSTRPGMTWISTISIPNGATVDILDQSLFPGGKGVWRSSPLMYYFVSATNTPYPIQGWIQQFFIEFTSPCPPLPPYEADYWTSGVDSSGVSDMPSSGGTPPPTVASVEVTAQTDSNASGDSDGDGLTDADESVIGTNPKAWDTDGDDIGDGSEIRGGTDPLNIDTDMDGEVDSQDQLPTIPNDPEATIEALLHTATAHAFTPTPSVTPSAIFSSTPIACNPTAPSRLSVGDQGRVIGEGRTGVNLRGNYGFDAPLIRLLDLNTEFEVIDLNAICVEGTNWYKIAIDGEEAGWIPETMWVIDDGAASNVYVIEPLD